MFETTNQMTLFKGHFPPNDRKRERERERASWMPNDMVQYLQETGHQRWNFSHRFCQLGECAQQYLLGLRQV